MLKFTKDSRPDAEKYFKRLSHRNYIYFHKPTAESIKAYESSRAQTLQSLALRCMLATSNNFYKTLRNADLRNYLIDEEFCPSYRFDSRDNNCGYSVAKKTVLEPLFEDGYATEFLGYFLDFKGTSSRCSNIDSVIKACRHSDEVDNFNRELSKVHFKVDEISNLRFGYSDIALVTMIAHEYDEAVTVPKGYVLVWGDFKQSDLRIAYNLLLRDENNSKIMDKYTDKYEGLARIVADVFNEEFDEESFLKERDLYKVHTLSTMYGRRKGKTAKADKFISKLSSYLDNCPRYKEFYRRLDSRCKLGLPIQVTDYFGHTTAIEVSKYNHKDTIFAALNSPIQTGTSQIMILLCNTVLDMFYERGYTEDDISIYYNRHDEPLFMVKETALKDSWIFKECSRIIVDNWTPLEMDFSFGYQYGNEDQGLTAIVLDNWKKNEHKITNVESDTSNEFTYCPVPKALNVSFALSKLPNHKTIMACYYLDDNTCQYFLLETTEATTYEELLNIVETKFALSDEQLYNSDYRGVVVHNGLIDKSSFYSYMFFNYIKDNSLAVQKAEILAVSMNSKYCKKYNLQPSVDTSLLQYNIEFLDSVKQDNKLV